MDLTDILARWSSGQMTAEDVEEWANAIECRDDVDFENEEVSEVISELANLALHAANSLDEVAARLLP